MQVRSDEIKKNPNVSIIKNPWDYKATSNITIKINDQKYDIDLGDRRAFCFATSVMVEDKEVALNTLHFDKLLEINTKNNYEITFEDSHLGEKRVFRLPKAMNRNLFDFLTGGRRKDECCMDFINAMFFGCGKIKLNTININGNPTIIKDDKKLEIGQAIGIGTGSNESFRINHLAIYIGGGLFISVIGYNSLYITTLEQMSLVYKANNAAKITPDLPMLNPVSSYNI